MSIRISTVRIAGFRGINFLEIHLPRIAVLIGVNNSGKTSLLKALQLAIGDYSRYLSEEDFHIGADEKTAKEIVVDIKIVPSDSEGKRTSLFNEEWATEFGDKIKAEADGNQFLALRSRSKPNSIKGGFDINRFTLERWPDSVTWQTEKPKESKLANRFLNMPFFPIEAQRDVHHELKEKSSFVGRVLSAVEYDAEVISSLESQIKAVNEEAVNKSIELQSLKKHLKKLNNSFQGSGTPEITPFPKKIRDLSKHFTVHFGENSNGTFSMEYHGMGTRSWASMLTLKAFVELSAEKHKEEVEPFFPILAVEEPEAHLHPNAQRTLYWQLAESQGQVIISTHSPYLAAMADQSELRCLQKSTNNITVHSLSLVKGTDDYRKLQREVIHSRGELLFSKAIVLCEGETEEQALPLFFKKKFTKEPFELGINIIGVGGSGKKYLPFLTFARDFSIPAFIFSDGEENTIRDLKKHYDSVFGKTDINNSPQITILENTNFEEYLVDSGFKSIIETAIIELDGDGAIDKWIEKKHGSSYGRKKTDKPPCKECEQPIFEDVLRDYKADGGLEAALKDMLCANKTKYAPAIAAKLCDLDPKDFPPKIVEFLDKIIDGAEL